MSYADDLETTFCPYFDQEQPQCEIVGMIADEDLSDLCWLEAQSVFECNGGRYSVVHVFGNSLWPDTQYNNTTSQTVCTSISEVDQSVGSGEESSWSGLIERCQSANWKATRLAPLKQQ